jgi:uncharacterized membrane protein YcjF (UPF0283 family)
MRSKAIMMPLAFGILAVATGLTYLIARDMMITTRPWLYVVQSNVTLNFVLFLFGWGVTSEQLTKGKTRRAQWIVFGIGMIAIILFFKFVGGFPTIAG